MLLDLLVTRVAFVLHQKRSDTCLLCTQFGVAEEKMMEKLWGDNFFDPKTKKWTKKHTGAESCK